MPKKERAAKAAAFAMAQELDSEMTEEEMKRLERKGMGIVDDVGRGSGLLDKKELTKEEKEAKKEEARRVLQEKKEAAAQMKAMQEKIAAARAEAAAAEAAADAPGSPSDGGAAVDVSDAKAAPAAGKDASGNNEVNAEYVPKAKKEKKTKEEKEAEKAARAAKKAEKLGKKGGGAEAEAPAAESAESGGALLKVDEGTLKFAVCTGNLASRKDSKDVKIMAFSISLFGKVLFDDQTLELTWGHRYGLIGQNGSGKTTLLKCIATRQIPIPDFIDIWYLDKEAEPQERSALDCVVDTVRLEKERLEKLEEDIMSEVGPEDPRLEAIYEKLDKMDPSTFDKRAGELLFGLGFSQTMMKRNT
jgi:hypothetical protein